MDFFEALQIISKGGKVEHVFATSRLVIEYAPPRNGQKPCLIASSYRGNILYTRKPLILPDYFTKNWKVVDGSMPVIEFKPEPKEKEAEVVQGSKTEEAKPLIETAKKKKKNDQNKTNAPPAKKRNRSKSTKTAEKD